MKYLFALSFLIIPFFVKGQTIPTASNQRNAEGKRIGEWVITYSKSWKETTLKDSIAFYRVIKFDDTAKPVGKTTDYYLNGQKQWEGTLLEMEPEEIMDGLAVWYNSDSLIVKKYFFKGKELTIDYLIDNMIKLNNDPQKLYLLFYKASEVSNALFMDSTNKGKIEKEIKVISKNDSLIVQMSKFVQYLKKTKYELRPYYINCVRHIAKYYVENNNYKLASKYYELYSSIMLNKFGANSKEFNVSLDNIVACYESDGNFPLADSLHNKILENIKISEGENSMAYINKLNDLVGFYDNFHLYNKSEPLLLNLLEFYDRTNGDTSRVYTEKLKNLAANYFLEEKYKDALAIFKKNYILSEKAPWSTIENNFENLYFIVKSYKFLNQKEDGTNFLNCELGKFNKQKHIDISKNIKVLGYLSDMYYYLENIESCKNTINNYINLIPNDNFLLFEGAIKKMIKLYETDQSYSKIDSLFIVSLKYIKNNDVNDYSDLLISFAKSYLKSNHLDQAFSAVQLLKIVFFKNSSFHKKIEINSMLCDVLFELGEHSLLQEIIHENLHIIGKIPKNSILYIDGISNQINYLNKIGEFTKAEKILKEFLSLEQNKESYRYKIIEASLYGFQALSQNKNHTKAITLILEITENLLTNIQDKEDFYDAIIKIYLSQKNFIEALKIIDHHNIKRFQIYRAIIDCNLGNFNSAEIIFYNYFKDKPITFNDKYFMKYQMTNYFNLGKTKEAIDVYKRIVKLFKLEIDGIVNNNSEKNQLYLLKSASSDLDFAYSFAYRNKELIIDIFNYHLYKSNIIRNRFSEIMKIDTNEISQYKSFKKLQSYSKKDMLQQIDSLEQKLLAKFRFTEKRSIDTKYIINKLKANTISIEFISHQYHNGKNWTDTTFYSALLLSPEWKEPKMVRLFEKRQLVELLGKNISRETLANSLYRGGGKIPDVSVKSSQELYKLVWQPLDSLLQGVKTIYYSPSGLLHQLNLSAIPVNDSLTLGEKYNMHRLGSTRQLAEENNFTTVSNHSLLMGNINFDADSVSITAANKNIKLKVNIEDKNRGDENNRGDKWDQLINTGLEISAIAKYSKNADTLTFNNATEDAFYAALAKKPKVIHLATHGFFYDAPKDTMSIKRNEPIFVNAQDAMLRSGLILAGANRVWMGGTPIQGQEDGILTAYEVSLTDMRNTELVVTSACETALGDVNGSEGVFGLQRAFKIAGAKNLLMSLWKVNDAATKDYMETFYRLYLIEGKSIHDSYQLTQSQMKKKYKDPYYWAAFILLE